MNKKQIDKLNEVRSRYVNRRQQRNDYGVKGMKWGEHKAKENNSSVENTISSIKKFGKGSIYESSDDLAKEMVRSGYNVEGVDDETVFVSVNDEESVAVDLEYDSKKGAYKISDVYDA